MNRRRPCRRISDSRSGARLAYLPGASAPRFGALTAVALAAGLSTPLLGQPTLTEGGPGYRNEDYGLSFSLPFNFVKSLNSVYWRVPETIDVLRGGYVELAVMRMGPAVLDEAYVADARRQLAQAEAQVPQFRVIEEPRLTRLEDRDAVFMVNTDALGKLCATTIVCQGEDCFAIRFITDADHESYAVHASELAHETLTFSTTTPGLPATEIDMLLASLPGLDQHLETLDRIFRLHRWERKGLEAVITEIGNLGGLRIDFGSPPRSLVDFVARHEDPAWPLYLNAFFRANALRYTMTPMKADRLSQTEYAALAQECAAVQRIPVVQREWKTLSLRADEGPTEVRLHTDAGSALTVADVHAELDLLQFSGSSDKEILLALLVRIASLLNGLNQAAGLHDPTDDLRLFLSESPKADEMTCALVGIAALSDVLSRRRAGPGVYELRVEGPVLLDVHVYREQESFRSAAANYVGGLEASTHARSFAPPARGDTFSIYIVAERDTTLHDTMLRQSLCDAVAEGGGGLGAVWRALAAEAAPFEDMAYTPALVWSDRAAEISATISHELDHALVFRKYEENLPPRWFMEGEATGYGEYHDALNQLGVAVGMDSDPPVYGPDGAAVLAIADSLLPRLLYGPLTTEGGPPEVPLEELMLRYDSAVEKAVLSNALLSRRARHYIELLGVQPKSELKDNLARLLLTPESEFGRGENAELHYALAWAMVRAVSIAKTRGSSEWSRHRVTWELVSAPSTGSATLRERYHSGELDGFLEWIAEEVYRWHQQVRQ